MNITKSVIERNLFNKSMVNKEEMSKEAIGIIDYHRIIVIYPSTSKNLYNIDGNNILTTSKCAIINYSISVPDHEPDKKIFSKTTYICDLNFPGNITPEMLMESDMSRLLNGAKVDPLYGFNNIHVEYKDGEYCDHGLTMADLYSNQYDYGVLNFSGENKDNNYHFQDILMPQFFNPKLYIPKESEIKNNIEKKGMLMDFIDEHTRIVKDVNDYKKNVKYYKNGIERKERIINKRIIKTNELLLDIFSDLIFIPIEDFQFITKVENDIEINVQKLTTFKRFNNQINNYYYEKVIESITKTISNFKNDTKEDNFYISVMKNEVLFSINIYFKNQNSNVDEIRITSPIYKMYSQFALNNESIIESIENDTEYAKLNLLETCYENPDNMLRNAIADVKEATRIAQTILNIGRQADSYKSSLLENHAKSQQKLLE